MQRVLHTLVYATRDLLIISSSVENNFSDFIPTSVITRQEYQHVPLDLYTLKDENVINNHMNDLNLISKTHKQLQENNESGRKLIQLKDTQIIHNYILYIIILTSISIPIAFTLD